ncbi:MAG: DNA-formamidopyrimidine glycosylase, partial [Syntrophomonadaceae bacterium]|nr:DNA-formamidopyrimidine glycosylase [Syntrophomonadaceae bacterium]
MPELPEVETIRLSLQSIIGVKIDCIEVRRGDIIRQEDFPPGELHGQTITAIRRRGKYLAVELANGL